MSEKKVLSLIYGDRVHKAPKGKVIPAKELSKLISASELLTQVKKEAEKYRLEVAKECEVLKEQTQKEGFNAGFEKWTEKLAELEAEIASVHKAMEKTVIPVALKAARKILGRELELSETAIVDIVATKLKAVASHKRITISVNKEDFDRLENGKERLKKLFENLETLSIRPRADIERGGCVIETEGGIINAQIENQWEIIERAFQALNPVIPPPPASVEKK